jgi:tRNA pseudouridine55 synthase
MTSFDLAAYTGRMLKVKKIGHAGTLDPGACGLMTLCIGKATRISDFMMEKDKTYIAEIKFGSTTDTYDSFGSVTSNYEYEYDTEKLKYTISHFIGETMQLPPMYSAVKINGQKLYELARKGIQAERKYRRIVIRNIDILDDSDPYAILIKIECSKGTYIRSLVYDIGLKYGSGAHMGFLLRTRSGDFDISSAYTIEEVRHACENNKMDDIIISMDEALSMFERIVLCGNDANRFINGAFIENAVFEGHHPGQLVRVMTQDKRFLGIGEFIMKGDKALLKTKKLLTDNDDINR